MRGQAEAAEGPRGNALAGGRVEGGHLDVEGAGLDDSLLRDHLLSGLRRFQTLLLLLLLLLRWWLRWRLPRRRLRLWFQLLLRLLLMLMLLLLLRLLATARPPISFGSDVAGGTRASLRRCWLAWLAPPRARHRARRRCRLPDPQACLVIASLQKLEDDMVFIGGDFDLRRRMSIRRLAAATG